VDVLVLDLPSLGRLGRTSGRSVTILDRALRLLDVASETDGAAERYTTRGALTPDNVLRFGVTSVSDSSVTGVAPGDAIELPSLWPLRMAFGGRLRRGRRAAVRVLDPFSLDLRPRAFHLPTASPFIVPATP